MAEPPREFNPDVSLFGKTPTNIEVWRLFMEVRRLVHSAVEVLNSKGDENTEKFGRSLEDFRAESTDYRMRVNALLDPIVRKYVDDKDAENREQ